MMFFSHYFSHHRTDKNFLYILGKNSSQSMFEEFIKNVVFDNLYVLCDKSCQNSLCFSEKAITFVSKKEISKLENCSILIDGEFANNEMLSSLNGGIYKIMQSNESHLEILENFMTLTAKVILVTPNEKDGDLIMEWHANEYDKLLSIILPVYNVENYLEKCIKSITKWNAPYIEFIFVDDGSTDDSLKILNKAASNDERIKVFSKKNGGCASARQFGLDKSKGKYIGFVDPDDFVDDSMFQQLLEKALIGSFDIAYCGYNEYYEASGAIKKVPDLIGEPYIFGTFDKELIDKLIAYRRIAIWRAIYSKKMLNDNRIVFNAQLRRFDDLPFKVETSVCAKSVISIDKYLYYYRIGRDGQDVSARDKRLFVHFEIFSYLDKRLNEIGLSSRQKEFYRVVKIQTHYWAMSVMLPEFKSEYRALAAKDLGIDNTKKEWKKVMKNVVSRRNQKHFF